MCAFFSRWTNNSLDNDGAIVQEKVCNTFKTIHSILRQHIKANSIKYYTKVEHALPIIHNIDQQSDYKVKPLYFGHYF